MINLSFFEFNKIIDNIFELLLKLSLSISSISGLAMTWSLTQKRNMEMSKNGEPEIDRINNISQLLTSVLVMTLFFTMEKEKKDDKSENDGVYVFILFN